GGAPRHHAEGSGDHDRRGAHRRGAKPGPGAVVRLHLRGALLRPFRVRPGRAPLAAAEGLQRVLPLSEVQHVRRDRDGARPVKPRSATWRPVAGGVTAARGYQASGVAAGIKKEGPDLAVVFSTLPALGAALFTRNRVVAAPVIVSRKHLRRSRGRIRAVLLNSGCANACTGAR